MVSQAQQRSPELLLGHLNAWNVCMGNPFVGLQGQLQGTLTLTCLDHTTTAGLLLLATPQRINPLWCFLGPPRGSWRHGTCAYIQGLAWHSSGWELAAKSRGVADKKNWNMQAATLYGRPQVTSPTLQHSATQDIDCSFSKGTKSPLAFFHHLASGKPYQKWILWVIHVEIITSYVALHYTAQAILTADYYTKQNYYKKIQVVTLRLEVWKKNSCLQWQLLQITGDNLTTQLKMKS